MFPTKQLRPTQPLNLIIILAHMNLDPRYVLFVTYASLGASIMELNVKNSPEVKNYGPINMIPCTR